MARINQAETEWHPTGLCGSCAHARQIQTPSKSTFYLCELSAHDATFPKYPRLPVIQCTGHVRQQE